MHFWLHVWIHIVYIVYMWSDLHSITENIHFYAFFHDENKVFAHIKQSASTLTTIDMYCTCRIIYWQQCTPNQNLRTRGKITPLVDSNQVVKTASKCQKKKLDQVKRKVEESFIIWWIKMNLDGPDVFQLLPGGIMFHFWTIVRVLLMQKSIENVWGWIAREAYVSSTPWSHLHHMEQCSQQLTATNVFE